MPVSNTLQPMRVPLCVAITFFAGGAFQPSEAQGTPPKPLPSGAFIGRVIGSIDSLPARSVEVRLLFVDSARTANARKAGDSLDLFIDSLKTRIAVTDSTGAFAIRALAAGGYIVRLRRIGYEPVDAALRIEHDTLRATFVMPVASQLLAQMTIRETTIDRVTRRLANTGYKFRKNSGLSGTFLDRQGVLRHNRPTLDLILNSYGIYDGDLVIDRMQLPYDDVRNYPTDLVIGIEIYRRGRPMEFNWTRDWSQSAMLTVAQRPLIVVWTFIP
jgi:hypothetical protein